MVRVVHAQHRNETVKCASWAHRVRTLFIHSHGEDIVVWRVISNEEDRLLRPVCDRVCQALVHIGTLAIRSDLDVLVELAEKLEGDVCDFEFTEEVPCYKCVEKLLCGMQSPKILRLKED